MDLVISEPCYKGNFYKGITEKWVFLQRNYRKKGIFTKELQKNGKFHNGITGKWPFHGHFPVIPL